MTIESLEVFHRFELKIMKIERFDDANIDSAVYQEQQNQREKRKKDCKGQVEPLRVEQLEYKHTKINETVAQTVKQLMIEEDRLMENFRRRLRDGVASRNKCELQLKEFNARHEKSTRIQEEEPVLAQESKEITSSPKPSDQTMAIELNDSKEAYIFNTNVGPKSADTCACCGFERGRKRSYPATSTMLDIRLQRLKSILSKLGSTAQESAKREVKLEEEFSEAKRAIFRFASSFKNSLPHEAIGDLLDMFPKAQTNGIDHSRRTTTATNNSTSKYIATLYEIGKILISQCMSIAAKYSEYTEVVRELHEFQDAASERMRREIDEIRSMKDEFEQIKRALALRKELREESTVYPQSFEETKYFDEARLKPENILRESMELKMRCRGRIESSKESTESARLVTDGIERLWAQSLMAEKVKGNQLNKNDTVSKQVLSIQNDATAKKGYIVEDEPQDININTIEKGMEVYNCL